MMSNMDSKGSVDLFEEKVERYIGAIDAFEDYNIITGFDREQVRQRAREIRSKLETGSAGPLAGMVVAVKDVLCERGKKVTCSSETLRNFESVYTATSVQRLLDKDALLIARTNMDEFAMGSSTENSIFGPAKNPVNPEYVTGGSSGGSAAAVAADLCDVALGSDTGGSIRQPAAYCGVVGLKPSYGRVSRYGLVAFASSFDCVGPFAKTVEDAAMILQHLAGYDPMDQSSSQAPVPDYLSEIRSKKHLKIGIPGEYFAEGLDFEIRFAVEEQLRALEKEGHTLHPITLPHTNYAIATYYILATAEASSNLARYDGIRYGHRADADEMERRLKEGIDDRPTADIYSAGDSPLIRLYKQSRTEGFGDEVKRRILLGTYVLSKGYYDAYYGKAQRVRRLIQNDFSNAFREVDVIASPTAPTTAFKIGEKTQMKPMEMYLNDIYTISANLAGICGISVPLGTHSNGLPMGIQFQAASMHETDLLHAAKASESLGRS
jgi:aspartyl-tRNA(Asn)/glutamyl-tRNA(Gln) amidotransferase subunit A